MSELQVQAYAAADQVYLLPKVLIQKKEKEKEEDPKLSDLNVTVVPLVTTATPGRLVATASPAAAAATLT